MRDSIFMNQQGLNLYTIYENFKEETEIHNFMKVFLDLGPLNLQEWLEDHPRRVVCLYNTGDLHLGFEDRKFITLSARRNPLLAKRRCVQNTLNSVLFPRGKYRLIIIIRTKRGMVRRIQVLVERRRKKTEAGSYGFEVWGTQGGLIPKKSQEFREKFRNFRFRNPMKRRKVIYV